MVTMVEQIMHRRNIFGCLVPEILSSSAYGLTENLPTSSVHEKREEKVETQLFRWSGGREFLLFFFFGQNVNWFLLKMMEHLHI